MSKATEAEAFVKQLEKKKIPAAAAKTSKQRWGLQSHVFFVGLTTKRDSLRIWPGDATLTIEDHSPKFQQIVLRVKEVATTITRTYEVGDWADTDGHIFARFPIAVPEDTTFILDADSAFILVPREVTVTANVPASTRTFLIGKDEKTLFVSQLPKNVTTVEAAHKCLRPKGLPKDALRQGEWFFVRVPKSVQKDIEKKYWNSEIQYLWEGDGIGDGMETDHAVFANYSLGKTYCTGPVVNPRHETLWLNDGWYEPVHNLEVISDDNFGWD